MRTATYLVMGALGMACAHQPAPPAAQRAPLVKATPAVPETRSPPSEGSGDPRLGNLEPTHTQPAPRAEAASELGASHEGPKPRTIEPEAPTVATTPPGSAHAQPAAQPASKEEAELRARIQRTLARDNSLSFTAKRVRVEVDRGRVTLLGEVRTAREKTEVEALVEKVTGVRRVENQLAVIEKPLSNAP